MPLSRAGLAEELFISMVSYFPPNPYLLEPFPASITTNVGNGIHITVGGD